jgi:hypothetical protein
MVMTASIDLRSADGFGHALGKMSELAEQFGGDMEVGCPSPNLKLGVQVRIFHESSKSESLDVGHCAEIELLASEAQRKLQLWKP